MGLAVYSLDSSRNYDLRLKLRGSILKENPITLILFSAHDWAQVAKADANLVRPLKEITSFTDGYFWHEETWLLTLRQILVHSPKGVGVTLFFSPSVENFQEISTEETLKSRSLVFRDPRVFWASRLDSDGALSRSRFASSYLGNSGLSGVPTDSDGIARRFPPFLTKGPHISTRLAQKLTLTKGSGGPAPYGELINFQGPPGTYSTYTLKELLAGRVPSRALKDKVVLLGATETAEHLLLTPVGQMSRAEVIANMIHNQVQNAFIQEISWPTVTMLLLTLLVGSVFVISHYPQVVALVILSVVAGVSISLSLWLFDSFFIWTPIAAPLAQVFATFVVFQSFQLSQKSKRAFELEQERKLLKEMEAMKNNFMSLISHDLKTPLAKIQAVVAARSGPDLAPEVATDFAKLASYAQELQRYIQSILQASRADAQAFQLQRQAVDLNEVAGRTVRELSGLATHRQIKLITDLEPQFSVDVDPTLIYEVMLNLVENAIKYTPEGGLVTLQTREVGDSVVFSVMDSGPGIDAVEQTNVWSKFYRGKRHELTTKGTGLGLYLVKYFVELHGGRVFLESQLGQGTRIGFELPLAEAAEHQKE